MGFDKVVTMIFEEVVGCIKDGYVNEDKEITFDTRLVEDLELDFLDLTEIYGELEGIFEIDFHDEIDEAKTISDVMEHIMDQIMMGMND